MHEINLLSYAKKVVVKLFFKESSFSFAALFEKISA